MSAGTPLNVGIIGQGRSGRDIHAFAMRRQPERYRIVAVTDPLEERRTRARQEFGCEAYEDYRELLRHPEIDLIVNATPSHLHVPVSLEFLERGFHVLCEKPLARRAGDVDRLMEAADRADRRIAVFHQLRFSPAFRQLRRVIDSGVLGRIVQIRLTFAGFSRRWDWQTLQENNGGTLLNIGPHAIDQAMALYGPEGTPDVFCRLDRAVSSGDAEDYAKIELTGAGRPLIDIELSSCCTYPGDMFQVQGTCGGLTGSHAGLTWKYFKPEESPAPELVRQPLSNADGTPAFGREQLVWYEESWTPADGEADPYDCSAQLFYAMLYDALRTGAALPVEPAEVRRQIAVIERCYELNPSYALRHRF